MQKFDHKFDRNLAHCDGGFINLFYFFLISYSFFRYSRILVRIFFLLLKRLY